MNRYLHFILTILLLSFTTANAKGGSGIYMTTADFRNNKLTYESDCAGRHSIHLHGFFGTMPNMVITANGKRYTLKKSTVFGYKDCNNNAYRFYKNTAYHIEEAGGIVIYTTQRNVTQSKGFRVVNDYWFSVSTDSGIMPLDMYALRNAYQDNSRFLDLLDTHLLQAQPYEYDQAHNTFRINYLFAKAMNL